MTTAFPGAIFTEERFARLQRSLRAYGLDLERIPDTMPPEFALVDDAGEHFWRSRGLFPVACAVACLDAARAARLRKRREAS